jgi:hypothetical protein
VNKWCGLVGFRRALPDRPRHEARVQLADGGESVAAHHGRGGLGRGDTHRQTPAGPIPGAAFKNHNTSNNNNNNNNHNNKNNKNNNKNDNNDNIKNDNNNSNNNNNNIKNDNNNNNNNNK